LLGHFHHLERHTVWQKDICYDEVKFYSFKHLARIIKFACDAHIISMVLQSTEQPNSDIMLVFEQQNMFHDTLPQLLMKSVASLS